MPPRQSSRLTDHACPVCSCPVPLHTNPDIARVPDEIEDGPEKVQWAANWAAFLIERCPNGPHVTAAS